VRILHAIPGLAKAAGTSVYCAELAGHLACAGVETVIALPDVPGDDRCPTPAAVAVGRFDPTSPPPDLVHVHGLWHPFLHRVAAWAAAGGVPVLVSPQGMLTPWSLAQKRLKKRLALAAYQHHDLATAAAIHATAQSEVDDVRRLGLRQPIVVAPFGIAIPDAASAPPRWSAAAGGRRVALFVSRIHPKKGLVNLLEAWARLRAEHVAGAECGTSRPPWCLVIAGPDEAGHKAELLALAAARGLAVEERPPATTGPLATDADIVFTGPVFDAQKTALYQRSDLFVLPTHSENFGVVVLEALACGLPVLTTKGAPWGTLEDVGRPGPATGREPRAGWWIDVGVEPLVATLRGVMHAADESLRDVGDNARWFAAERYSWPAAARTMCEAYEWLVHGGPGGTLPSCIHLDRTDEP